MLSLEAFFSTQSEALSYSMWVLSRLLGFLRLHGFTSADPSLFNQLVTALSKSLAHQTSVTAAHTAYICHWRQEFYLSHLLAYFSDVNKRSILESPAVFADSLFREVDVAHFLDAMRSQQALVDVAFWGPSSFALRPDRYSLHRSPSRSSPARRDRRESGSPSRSTKKVRFDSPVPSPALKSPRKSNFATRGHVSRLAGGGGGGGLAARWEVWELWGTEPWVVQVLKIGYKVPFVSCPPLFPVPLPLPSYSPNSIRGLALAAAVDDLRMKDAIELASSEPSYYSCQFVTLKVTDDWRPVIDLSHLNRFVRVSHFHMETSLSVFQSLCPGDWMVSIDLQDPYLQVPVHPES